MAKKKSGKGKQSSHGGRKVRDLPPPPPEPYGPVTMSEKLLGSKEFALGIRALLKRIRNEQPNNPNSVEKARLAKLTLDQYYTTASAAAATEMDALFISKENQAALLRCTDRTNLILYAASKGSAR